MLKKSYLLIIPILLYCIGLTAQEESLKYSEKLSISNGLAHNGVTSILEDSRGFLWFGTYDGINRYDGYEVKTYKNTIDQNILISNRVRAISEDEKGNLWFGTDEGVSIYDVSKEKFEKIYSNQLLGKNTSGPIVRNILIAKELGLIVCLTEGNGVALFNEDHSFIGRYIPTGESFDKNILFYKGIKLNNTNYVFTTSSGLILFNLKTKQFKKLLENKIDYCNSVIKLDEETLLISLLNGVAFVDFKIKNGAFNFKLVHKSLENYQFNSLLLDPLQKLWLGTLNDGLIKIDDVNSLKNLPPFKIKSFKDGMKILRMSSLVATKNNYCWAATFNKGLYKFNINQNPFKYYNIKMGHKHGLLTNSVTHVAPLDDDRVYLTASFGGMALFNTKTEKFEKVPLKLSKQQLLNISSVFVDSKKNVWFRAYREKFLYRLKNGESLLEKVVLENLSTTDNIGIRSFTEDKYGNIWIGLNNDVYKISLNKNNKIINVESLNKNVLFNDEKLSLARYIYADPIYNYIWIGADSDGLFRISYKENDKVEDLKIDRYVKDAKNPLSISSNFVTSIIRLPNEDLWVGTEGGGICKVLNSDSNPEFIAYTEKNGLSNNVVKSILYDDDYNLWISTNIGLNKYNAKEASFRRFNDSDGLPFEDFWFAASRLGNGNMLFSGLDGFCYINPKNIKNDEKLPKLEFENFKLFNKLILPGDTVNNRVLLKKHLTNSEIIELKYNENVFSLDLTSLHFSNPENHKLRYKLSPINEDWVEVPSSQKIIYYNGLQPGPYELNVMASNSLNEWTEPKKLKILITPPFWKTTKAYFLYILLIGLIIFLIVRVILKIQSLNYKVQIEQIEINNVKELNKAKLQFFSNISHEIKTPLTLISGPISILINRFKNNADVKEKLEIVKRQSKKISQLVDQVHDFQRSDANLLKMHYSTFCFDTFINELLTDFKFLANNDNKNIEIIRESDEIYVSADKDKLEKILNNLLNNAFKYTKAKDSIKIIYKKEHNNLVLKVCDTGRGIDKDDIEHIFERFYQSQKKHNTYIGGSGIGLAFSKRLVDMHYGYIKAESELNEGTKFTIVLPIVQTEFNEYQKEKELEILTAEKTYTPNQNFENNDDLSGIEVNSEFANSKIFFAEDNSDMRKFVSGVLSNFFQIKSFVNGKECINEMENEWPDVVVSDVLMPEMNGFDLCKRIKSNIKTSHIPVILLTASTAIEDQLQGLKDGADSYIKKPFNIQYLITRIESILQNRKQLRERYKMDFPLNIDRDETNSKDEVFLEKLYNLIKENLDNQNLDLNSFAKELYLNRTHFYQKVKVLTNQTPFELLKNYRLKKAAEFLLQKKISVNEVYVMTGFKSRTHFTKLFKEKYNTTPGKYAAETKKKFNS
ncbi:ATP-binding protein [Lutibacter sp. A64]|uniref:hybrid sensor histidine kinase/response regulator transcription factor n=1 Tax=Lutibacter sp. A64 TaxID=2918526 RepID=UPI001F05F986|nr:two-component regulator propeller domain-containing protein [Lutibacter sp. A64]UMB54029.1 ATP-binding protein [Lutibacter sp. A64]